MISRVFCCLMLSSLLLTAGGCISAPEWVEIPPDDTAVEVFFTGSGSDPGGDAAKAVDAAENSLLAAVTRYLGVRISTESTVQTRATVSSYQAEISELISEESDAFVSDLRIIDKHTTRNRDGTIIVHLLGSYQKDALLAEKERIAALFAERIEAVAGPERQGDAETAAGETYKAAVSYLNSAAAALESPIDNADIIFRRVMLKAVDSISGITVEKVSSPKTAGVGKEIAGDFSVMVRSPAGVLAGVPFEVTWIDAKPRGRVGLSSGLVISGTGGLAVFSHPAPVITGENTVFFSLTFAPQLEPLKSATGEADEIIRSFERAVAQKSVEFTFQVLSESMGFDTAVYVVENGGPGGATESGISASLSEAGFSIVPFMGDRYLLEMDAAGFIKTVRDERLTEAKRIVYGSAGVVGTPNDGGVYLAEVTAQLQVVDVESGTIVYTIEGVRTGRGRSRNAAIAAAFRELGEQLGAALARELP